MLFPCLYIISTLSMQLPSASPKRYFIVPSSFETSFLRTSGRWYDAAARSLALVALPMLVITSGERGVCEA